MEGLALSAVVLVALSVPGSIVYYRYLRVSATWEISGANELQTVQLVVAGLMVSLVFHALWGVTLDLTPFPVNYEAVFAVLMESDDGLDEVTSNSLFLVQASGYFFSQCAAAWILGSVIGRLAEDKTDWSKSIALNSNGGVWHRLFRYPSEQGDKFHGPIVTLAHSEAGRSYLYQGVLFEYQLDPTGKLVRIVLTAAYRRDFPVGATDLKNQDQDHHWESMSGERFVVNCESVDTLEVDYIWLKKKPDQKQLNLTTLA